MPSCWAVMQPITFSHRKPQALQPRDSMWPSCTCFSCYTLNLMSYSTAGDEIQDKMPFGPIQNVVYKKLF